MMEDESHNFPLQYTIEWGEKVVKQIKLAKKSHKKSNRGKGAMLYEIKF